MPSSVPSQANGVQHFPQKHRALPSAGFITASWSSVAMLPAIPARHKSILKKKRFRSQGLLRHRHPQRQQPMLQAAHTPPSTRVPLPRELQPSSAASPRKHPATRLIPSAEKPIQSSLTETRICSQDHSRHFCYSLQLTRFRLCKTPPASLSLCWTEK